MLKLERCVFFLHLEAYLFLYKPCFFCFSIRKFSASSMDFLRIFRFSFFNFLSNESEIRNKRHKVCGGTNKLPNAKSFNVLPSKLRPVIFFNFQNFRKKCILQKNFFFFTFYIYVPIFRALGTIINFLQNRFGLLKENLKFIIISSS